MSVPGLSKAGWRCDLKGLWPMVTTLGLILMVPSVALGIERPVWIGLKSLEAKYRQDWYACYSEAEKTIPAVNLQAVGEGSMTTVAMALAVRGNSVRDLALACMDARGYVATAAESSKP